MILSVVAFVLLALLGVWWYFGFSVDFMRFFAVEQIPGVTNTPTVTKGTDSSCVAPAGCTCQQVQCVQAPCDPIIVCPSGDNTGSVSCVPAQQMTTVGQIAQLNAQGGTGSVTWFAPGGVLATSGSDSEMVGVSYSSKGIKKVTVQRARLVNGAASQFVDSVACTVVVQ